MPPSTYFYQFQLSIPITTHLEKPLDPQYAERKTTNDQKNDNFFTSLSYGTTKIYIKITRKVFLANIRRMNLHL